MDRKAEYEAQLKARQFRAGRDDPSSKVHTNATALGNTLLDHIQAEFPIKTDKIRGLFIEKYAEIPLCVRPCVAHVPDWPSYTLKQGNPILRTLCVSPFLRWS